MTEMSEDAIDRSRNGSRGGDTRYIYRTPAGRDIEVVPEYGPAILKAALGDHFEEQIPIPHYPGTFVYDRGSTYTFFCKENGGSLKYRSKKPKMRGFHFFYGLEFEGRSYRIQTDTLAGSAARNGDGDLRGLNHYMIRLFLLSDTGLRSRFIGVTKDAALRYDPSNPDHMSVLSFAATIMSAGALPNAVREAEYETYPDIIHTPAMEAITIDMHWTRGWGYP